MGHPDPAGQRDRVVGASRFGSPRRVGCRRLDPALEGATGDRGSLEHVGHYAEDHLPDRRQPGAAAARGRRARPRLHRPACRAPGRRSLAHLALPTRAVEPPPDRALLPAAPAAHGHRARAHRGHPRAGNRLTRRVAYRGGENSSWPVTAPARSTSASRPACAPWSRPRGLSTGGKTNRNPATSSARGGAGRRPVTNSAWLATRERTASALSSPSAARRCLSRAREVAVERSFWVSTTTGGMRVGPAAARADSA